MRDLPARFPASTNGIVEGEGEPIVLIHGVGVDHRMWGPIAARLAETRAVIRYDLLGHGASALPPASAALTDYVGQLAALLDALGVDRCDVAGFSLGSTIARGFAVRHGDRLRRLALLYGVYDRDAAQKESVRARLAEAEAKGPTSLVEAAVERWFTPALHARRPDVIAAVRRRLHDNDPKGFLPAYRVFALTEEEAIGPPAAIHCPCLVMTGEFDRNSTPAMSRALAAALPDARCVVLPGLAHMGLVEDPEANLRYLLPFLTTSA